MGRLTCRGLLGLFLLATLLFSACGPDGPDEVRVGMIAGASGERFREGRIALEAARFAVEAVNRAGGVEVGGRRLPVRLEFKDSRFSPEVATRMFRELAEKDEVVAVIGPMASREALAVAPVAAELHVPMFTTASASALADNDWAINIVATDQTIGRAVARYLASRGPVRAAILAAAAEPHAMAQATASAAEVLAEGGVVTGRIDYPDGTRDFGPMLAKLLVDLPGVLFIPNPTKEAILAANQARSQGFSGTLAGGDAWQAQEVARLPAFAGAVFVDHWGPEREGAVSERFARDYRAAGLTPTETAALTVDACRLLFAGLSHAGRVDPAALRQAVVDMPAMEGVTGVLDYRDNTRPLKDVFLVEIGPRGELSRTEVGPE